MGINPTEAAPDPNAALRFEDLTIDDDLSLLERVVRYVRSGIALQRLVHVKLIAETSKAVGTTSTINTLIPLLPPLMNDAESIIRQHLASQILPLCLTCMFGDDPDFNPNKRGQKRVFNKRGYKIVTSIMLNHINALIIDHDIDVRKAASDALATLALFIKPEDVAPLILPIPLRLAHDDNKTRGATSPNISKMSNKDDRSEELRITAANLLGDIASLDPHQIPPGMVSHYITPTIQALCQSPSFRVRRAAVQALPRVVSGSSADDVKYNLIPWFVKLSEDDMHRVRKSVGECLVDMSRSLMLLPFAPASHLSTLDGKDDFSKMSRDQMKIAMMDIRRQKLVPICTNLLSDNNKFVRHGMMQFLGPFIASFYPLEGDQSSKNRNGIMNLLGRDDSERTIGGMGVQFFPHANGMVSRLKPADVSTVSTNATPAEIPPEPVIDSTEYLESRLPEFLEKNFNDSKSLTQILHHRDKHPISQHDEETLHQYLLPPYVQLSTIETGDESVDAEMRVYCAYSLPAVVLLLGRNGWVTSLKDCFLALITGSKVENGEATTPSSVPLPVKRCLASSFHAVCHILGPHVLKASHEEKANKKDLLSIFDTQFLRDPDNTVRLNVIRNLPSFLSMLSSSKRNKFLPALCEIITGDTMMASKRKNARNPLLLNWRQRDMIAQIMPNVIMLYKAGIVRQFLWPVVKELLTDSVNIVRRNAGWSVPTLFRCYEAEKIMTENEGINLAEASNHSKEFCAEMFDYLEENFLNGSTFSVGAFSKRQEYCEILAATGLILRLGKRERIEYSGRFHGPSHPFYNLTSTEYSHIHKNLQETLLPSAIVMKDDRVTNVRLALVKSLRVMPHDIRDDAKVGHVLRILEDEVATWEGGGGQFIGADAGPSIIRQSKSKVEEKSSRENQSPNDNIKSEEGEKKATNRKYEEDSTSLASI